MKNADMPAMPVVQAPHGWQLVPSEVVTPTLSWPLDVGVEAFRNADMAGCNIYDCLYDAVRAMLLSMQKQEGK